MGNPAARVQELIEPLLTASDIELVDVELQSGVLAISVDRPGGIDLDAISDIARSVSEVLDEHDPVPGKYTLEVSSPGLERPLRTPAHFRRFVGTTVTVKTMPAVEGERRVTGTLEDADDDGISVAGRWLGYDQIERARTVFEWGPTPKLGGAPQRTKKPTKKKAAST